MVLTPALIPSTRGRHRRDARRRLSDKLGEIRASADESEPLVVTCVKMCMVQRKMELRDRVKDGEVDDKGDLKLVPCSKKSKAEDGSSRAHAACFEALINAGADVDQWDGEGLRADPPRREERRRGLRAVLVRFLTCVLFVLRVPREPPDRRRLPALSSVWLQPRHWPASGRVDGVLAGAMTYSTALVQQQYAIDAHPVYGNQPPRHRADALTWSTQVWTRTPTNLSVMKKEYGLYI